jgi:hypothetical protein
MCACILRELTVILISNTHVRPFPQSPEFTHVAQRRRVHHPMMVPITVVHLGAIEWTSGTTLLEEV